VIKLLKWGDVMILTKLTDKDLQTIKELGRIGATLEEVLAYFDVLEESVDTEILEQIEKQRKLGHLVGNIDLRFEQHKMKRDCRMLIHLGKDRLGQTDGKKEITGKFEQITFMGDYKDE
jgi:hypothetical protein